jgi:hypothetical protein
LPGKIQFVLPEIFKVVTKSQSHKVTKSQRKIALGLRLNHLKSKISFIVFILLSIILIYSRFLLPRFETHDILSIISWDVFGYYLYLPAYFIHHDLGIHNYTWVKDILDTYHPTIGFYQAYPGPVGDYVMKYPIGLAILNLPFFIAGHIFAHLLGYSPDGFTLPYQVSISMGGLVYAIAGLFIMRKVLLRFFNDLVSSVILVLIVLGTNYFELTAYDGAMPHNYLFTLYALVLWLTIRWYEVQKWKYAVSLGLTIGLATLVRFTDVICLLIPLLWGIYDKASFKSRWDLLREKYTLVIAFAVCFFLVLFIQMLYWKIHAGSFIYYSYEQGEKMKMFAPYLVRVLISFRKGWLIYTPMAIFMIIGLFFTWKMNRPVFIALFTFFIVNLLIIASWPTWWYGGSLGQRPFMESYAFMALPLGYFLLWPGMRKMSTRVIISGVFVFFIGLNLLQTWQYMNFIIEPSEMTRAYYWKIFGKIKVDDNDRKYLHPVTVKGEQGVRYENDHLKRILAYYDFEQGDQDYSKFQTGEFARTGKYSLKLTPDHQFSPGIWAKFSDITNERSVWVRATGYVCFTSASGDAKASLVMTCAHGGKAMKYQTLNIEDQHFLPKQWNKVQLDYQSPVITDRDDFLQVYFWYRGKEALYLDDFVIEIFEPKK